MQVLSPQRLPMPIRLAITLAPIVLWLGTWLFVSTAPAGDWPQILGPDRNGIAAGERLSEKWPQDGPRVVWQRAVGQGYAGVAVSAGRVVLFHRLENEAVAEAMDARSGKPLWKQAFPTRYQSGIAPDDGPRCVPLVHQGRVYLFGADGDLHCLRFDNGEVVWSRDTATDFRPPSGYFGAGSTPIVMGDKLLVNVGGAGAGIVAFNLSDGKTAWNATDEAASYSSPTSAEIDGERLAVFVARLNTLGVEPASGKVRFRFPFGMRGPTVNAATPLAFGDRLFVSASYGIGAKLVDARQGEVETVWARDDVMSSQYCTCVAQDGVLYGIDGRQDQGVARLRAFDLTSGKVLWTAEGFGTGNLILADHKLLILKTDGELVLGEANAEAWRPLATAKSFSSTVQPLPALADGLLYARDTGKLKCLAVGAEK